MIDKKRTFGDASATHGSMNPPETIAPEVDRPESAKLEEPPPPPPEGLLTIFAHAGKPGNFDGQTPTFDDIDTTIAVPVTPWETGQYIVCSDGEWVYWDGSVWKTGEAP